MLMGVIWFLARCSTGLAVDEERVRECLAIKF